MAWRVTALQVGLWSIVPVKSLSENKLIIGTKFLYGSWYELTGRNRHITKVVRRPDSMEREIRERERKRKSVLDLVECQVMGDIMTSRVVLNIKMYIIINFGKKLPD